MFEITLVDAALILVGLLLAFVGAALSVYAVTLTGFLVGAGAGYVVAPNLVGFLGVEGLLLSAGAVIVGGAIGAFLAYSGLSFAVLGIGAVVGAFLGRFAVAPLYAADAAGLEGTLLVWGATLAGMAAGAVFGFVLTRTTLVFSTAVIGSALGTTQMSMTEFEAAQQALSIDPLLFDPTAPLFLGVCVLGALTQLGLFRFGYVTKLVAILPGARRWTANNDGAAS